MIPMQTLSRMLDKESYEWLTGFHPEIIEAIETEVNAGHRPEEIKLFVLKQTGRLELALRCEQAARHIRQQKVEA